MIEWLEGIFLNYGSKATVIGQTILLLSLTIFLGIYLGKFKIKGVSLGITWVLFVGILLSHLGHQTILSLCGENRSFVNQEVFGFIKEFGLILFVYAIGLQVGPTFFSSLKKGGFSLNMLSVLAIVLSCLVTVLIAYLTSTPLSLMTGIMTGAVTNTPSLGAAQSTLIDAGQEADFLSSAYAVAYPLAVVGIIFTPMIIKWLFKINVKSEDASYATHDKAIPQGFSIKITNDKWDKLTVGEFLKIFDKPATITRVMNDKGLIVHAAKDTILNTGNIVRVVVLPEYAQLMTDMLGEKVQIDEKHWNKEKGALVSSNIVVTQSNIQGKKLGELHLEQIYDITIARIIRASIELVPHPNLILQLGDRVRIVGNQENISKVASRLGNQTKRLDSPNLITIFLGIFLGVVLGLLPIKFPGIPQPVKLGLAGGPLIVAILVARFGPMYKMVTFVTSSANMMIREIGIAMFLAAVGLTCGDKFFATIAQGGYLWVVYGILITIIPIIIVSIIARKKYKLPYNTITGMIAGIYTDPPALAFANQATPTDLPSTAYATVYPLTMFLRIFAAQVLILISL